MHNDVLIRPANPEDAAALLSIYAPYVERTAITFEYDVPTREAFMERIAHTLLRYPYLVAEENGVISGYAYAGPFKERAAYDWAVETTVYVDKRSRGRGVGARLYQALEQTLAAQNVLNLNACIAYPGENDPYLTMDSIHFHQHCGFVQVGRFHQCGFKFGRWYDMVWMEKSIGVHGDSPAAVKPFETVRAQMFERL